MSRSPKFEKGDRVIYVPTHAGNNLHHRDVEHGVVRSSSAESHAYFVLYDIPDLKMVTGDEDYTAKLTPSDNLWEESSIPWYESH